MGWTLNVVNPHAETNAPTIAAVGIAFTTLSLLVVLLRCYVRLVLIKKFGADDYIIVITWLCALGFTIVTIIQTKWGLGLQNLSDMPTENIYMFGLYQYVGAPFYILSILGFKLSLLFTFYRIAIQKAHRVAIVTIMVAVTGFHLCFLVVQLNLCTPVSKQWDPAVVGGNCLTAVPFYTSMAALTIMFDVITMILPFPVLLATQIPPKKKLILLGLFSLGTFITVIQIVRIQTIHSLQNYLDSSMLIMWSMVENNLGIIIASIPALSPLVRSWREKSTKSNSNGDGAPGSKSERGRSAGGSYALGSLVGASSGRVRLTSQSQNDRGLRGGEEGKSMTRTTVKSGNHHRHGGFSGNGDNSSEECIVPGKGMTEGIMTTTEIRVDEENVYPGPPGSRGGGDPFGDPKMGMVV